MASTTIKTYTSDVDGVTVAEEAHEGDPTKLSDAQHVRIVMTQGDHTYTVDAPQSSSIAALLRKRGTKAGKRGRKAQS